MTPITQAHQIIKRWITSCVTENQLANAHDAVINLYDHNYKAHGTDSSEELHHLCMQKSAELKKQLPDESDPYNLDIPGKD